jgi:hypothetical protein
MILLVVLILKLNVINIFLVSSPISQMLEAEFVGVSLHEFQKGGVFPR